MKIVIIIIQILAVILNSLAALLSILLFLRLRWPAPALWFLKLYASALSPLLVLIGVFSSIVGLATGSVFISLIGIYNILIFCIHIFSITGSPDASSSFEKAFGLDWQDKINPGLKNHFLPRNTVLKLPAVPDPRMEQNISFATIPGTDRKLLCDIWQPQENVLHSGLAFSF